MALQGLERSLRVFEERSPCEPAEVACTPVDPRDHKATSVLAVVQVCVQVEHPFTSQRFIPTVSREQTRNVKILLKFIVTLVIRLVTVAMNFVYD